MSDCGCEKNTGESPETNTLGSTAIYNHNDCRGITKDLLEMFIRPIRCALQYSLWDRIDSTQLELENAEQYLVNYIAAKTADPDTCLYRENLPIVQAIVNKLIYNNICL